MLYLLAGTAPLEVYRTVVGKVDVSLFRLTLALAIGYLIVNWGDGRWRAIRWIRHPLVVTYLTLNVVLLIAMLVHPINVFLGEREAAQIAIGVLALAVTAELILRDCSETAARAVVIGSILPILGASWQAIAPRIGTSAALPFLSQLPAARGLEVTRQALSSFGPIGVRAKGTFGDPDHFGVYLIFVLSLAIVLTALSAHRKSRTAQIGFGSLAVGATATLVATFSRSAWVGAAVATLLITAGMSTAWRGRALRPPTKRVTIAAAITVAILSAGVAPSVVKRIAPSSKINVISNREHEYTVEFAFDRFTAHPVSGIGPGGLGIELRLPPRTSGAASTYLTVAAQVGVFGLLALLAAAAFALGLLARTYRSLRGTPMQAIPIGLGAGYVGFLAANLTYDIWFDDFHWVLLGLIAGGAVAVMPARASDVAASIPKTPSVPAAFPLYSASGQTFETPDGRSA